MVRVDNVYRWTELYRADGAACCSKLVLEKEDEESEDSSDMIACLK